MAGLIFSYIYDIPSGAAIIFALVLMYGIIKMYFVTRKALRQ